MDFPMLPTIPQQPSDIDHPLLEPRNPAYTLATVRRAFIVWLKCGQKNEFRDVCNYYHWLEAMESKLPEDSRASSRHHEYSLFVSQPPISPYLQHLFPKLYSSTPYDYLVTPNFNINIQSGQKDNVTFKNGMKYDEYGIKKPKQLSNEDIFEASQVFKGPDTKYNEFKHMSNTLSDKAPIKIDKERKSEDFNIKNEPQFTKLATNKSNNEFEKAKEVKVEKKDDNGTTKEEIVETSVMIKNYCKEHQIPLKNFLENFKEYSVRCDLSNTVNNVNFYIKRKMVFEELGLAVKVFRAKSEFVANEKQFGIQINKKLTNTDTKSVNIINYNSNIIEDVNKITYRAITKDNVQDRNVEKYCNLDLNNKYIEMLKRQKERNDINVRISNTNSLLVNEKGRI